MDGTHSFGHMWMPVCSRQPPLLAVPGRSPAAHAAPARTHHDAGGAARRRARHLVAANAMASCRQCSLSLHNKPACLRAALVVPQAAAALASWEQAQGHVHAVELLDSRHYGRKQRTALGRTSQQLACIQALVDLPVYMPHHFWACPSHHCTARDLHE